jgi:glycosyltransferase involved in cell wall biosynthesis
MSSLTVLQIHNRYRQRGGEDTVAEKEAALLRRAGHKVVEHVVANPSEPIQAAASVLAAPWNPRAAARLREVVEDTRPDVAHIHNTWWALTPSIVGVLDRLMVPTVVTLHNYRLMCVNAQLFRDGAPCEDCVGSSPWHGVRYRCYRDSLAASTLSAATIQLNRRLKTWQRADRLLVLTEFARGRFIESGIPAERLFLKPNFVDDPEPRTSPPSASRTVLFVGRLSSEKGIAELLDWWADAPTSDLELVVIGDGPLLKELQPGRDRSVRFAGRMAGPEVLRQMLDARALVFPSVWYEGQPMVLLEAMAAGLPLVASNIGGIPETVSGTALLASPGDSAAWTGALARLADDRWVDEGGLAVRRLFEQSYSPEIGLARLINEFSEAIVHRRGKAS